MTNYPSGGSLLNRREPDRRDAALDAAWQRCERYRVALAAIVDADDAGLAAMAGAMERPTFVDEVVQTGNTLLKAIAAARALLKEPG